MYDIDLLINPKVKIMNIAPNITHDSIATVCEKKLKDKYVFLYQGGMKGLWYRWEGTTWERDSPTSIMESIRRVTRDSVDPSSKSHNKYSFYSGVEKIMRKSPVFARDVLIVDKNNH